MSVSTCPTGPTLQAWRSGGLTETEAAHVAEHVAACPQCREALAGARRASEFSFLQPAKSADELGWLSFFRVLRVLGAGSMGIVFEAEDTRLRRRVALKVMKPEVAADPVLRTRFVREARAVAALSNPHIITIFHVGLEGDVPFMAMELLAGQSLRQRLVTGPALSVAEILRIGADISLGLKAAHGAGLIHRDIKPDNLWLEPDGKVRILDFGLVRFAAPSDNLTRAGAVMGTPGYISPEQARGQSVDPRTDLFSLGCVLYEFLAGKSPFERDSIAASLRALATEEPAAIRPDYPDVPAALERLTLHLLEKNPDQRPASADAVAHGLSGIARKLADETVPSSRELVPTVVIAAGANKPMKRMLVVGVAALAATLLLIGTGTAVLLLRNRPSPTKPPAEAAAAETPPLARCPFTVRQARAHQEAWAKYLGVPVEHTNTVGMKFRLIPPGEFQMGVTPEDAAVYDKLGPHASGGKDASPAHSVRISRAFYIGEREVDAAQFREVMKREPNNPDVAPGTHLDGVLTQYCPWDECIEFCNRLSEREGFSKAYFVTGTKVGLVPDATGYRLPTEAEWEFACRAGTTTLWYYGMTGAEAVKDLPAAQQRHTARLDLPNPFGLHQLYASSSEYCWDFFNPDYYARSAAEVMSIDPLGPETGTRHVQRGGAHFCDSGRDLSTINSAVRWPRNDDRWSGFGRIVLPTAKK